MTIDAKNVLRLNMPQWRALQGVARGRTHFAQVSEILNAVASEADIVGLAIAEYLPWSVVEFAKTLNALPLRSTLAGLSRNGFAYPRNDDRPGMRSPFVISV